jgi:hypothetical protein
MLSWAGGRELAMFLDSQRDKVEHVVIHIHGKGAPPPQLCFV